MTRTYAPTVEQAAAIDAFGKGTDLVLEAGAGCGKTATLVAMARANRRLSGIYTAFNKKPIDDAKPRFVDLRVDPRTTHSLAYRTHAVPFAARLNPGRDARMLNVDDVAAMFDVRDMRFESADRKGDGAFFEARRLVSLANRTVRRFTSSADFDLTGKHVPWIEEVRDGEIDADQYREVVTDLARRFWADLTSRDGRTRFTHDVYRKMWQLSMPKLHGDFIMLDEAQDTPPVVEDVFRRQTHMQRIAVGDSSQAINGWTGAIDALKNLAAGGAQRLTLTQSFRFGPRIAEEANKWLAAIDAPIRLKGLDSIDSRVEDIAGAPAGVLCRTNVGAFGATVAHLDAGRRVHMVGGGKSLIMLARSAEALMQGRRATHSDLAEFSTWEQAVEASKEEDADGNLKVLVNLVNVHGPQGVINVLNRLVEAKDAQVTVSTCHKAKGSEWSTVAISDDFASGDVNAPIGQEAGKLAYVAVTRAQHVLDRGPLAYIDGK